VEPQCRPGQEVKGGRVVGLVDQFALLQALEEGTWVPAYEH
jgi:hypothetical protein